MQLRKHLVTASYVNDSLLKLGENAKDAGITVLGEMGLDPGIGNPTALNVLNISIFWCGVAVKQIKNRLTYFLFG